MLPIHIYSARTLEPWDWTTPWTSGIGGSEQSHIEMVERLAKRDLSVSSYAPLPERVSLTLGPGNAPWRQPGAFGEAIDAKAPGIYINYRDPSAFKRTKHPGQKWWVVAQDVDYGWDNETLSKVDRYLCLCKEHARYTARKYPILKGKLFISSNGVRSDYIFNFEKTNKIERVPYRMLYASSPDRGLLLLLENWFRIRERFPEATLHVAYGFNNMDTIIRAFGDVNRLSLKTNLESLLNQEGVTWRGRLNVDALLREHFESCVYASPSDWPETSGISYMEAMACGNIPVTTNFWAQGENCRYGFKVDGLPQKSDLTKALWLANLYKALEVPTNNFDPMYGDFAFGPDRRDMMDWARQQFNWERIVDQWVRWIEEDSPKPTQGQTFAAVSAKQ